MKTVTLKQKYPKMTETLPRYKTNPKKTDRRSVFYHKNEVFSLYSRVYVEITNICNRNCTFCPGTVRPSKRLTTDEFTFIANKLSGVTEYLYYHLMGEPLTHPLLPEFIRYANSLGFRSVITTNGTLLPSRGKELIDAGVYKVNISIHSFEEGSNDDYLKYINGCLDFADVASESGVLVILRLWNNGFDRGRNIDTLSIIKERFGDDWFISPRGPRIRKKLHLEYGERFEWPDPSAEDMGKDVFCYGLKDHFSILSDGRVVPCCLDREGVLTLGNIFSEDLDSILQSPRAKSILEGFSKKTANEELCRKCGYARRFDI